MSATKDEAQRVFNIINGYYGLNLVFRTCDTDEGCQALYVCGDYWRPGQNRGNTTHTPPAWYVGGKMYVNLSETEDFSAGGDNELAFLICHEIGHHITFPPTGLAYYVWFHIIQDTYMSDNMVMAYKMHMDFIVNTQLYRDKALNNHLEKNGLDLYKGALSIYKFSRYGHTIADSQLKLSFLGPDPGPLRYNELAIWRETDRRRFDGVSPRPRYDVIERYCMEFLNARTAEWDPDEWFEFTYRTLVETITEVFR